MSGACGLFDLHQESFLASPLHGVRPFAWLRIENKTVKQVRPPADRFKDIAPLKTNQGNRTQQ